MKIGDDIFIVELKEASFSPKSKQVISDKGFGKDHQIVQIIGRVNVIERANNEGKKPLVARFDKNMLRFCFREHQECHDESR